MLPSAPVVVSILPVSQYGWVPVDVAQPPTDPQARTCSGLDPVSPQHGIRGVDASIGSDGGPVQNRMILEAFDISLKRDAVVAGNEGQADIGLGVGLGFGDSADW